MVHDDEQQALSEHIDVVEDNILTLKSRLFFKKNKDNFHLMLLLCFTKFLLMIAYVCGFFLLVHTIFLLPRLGLLFFQRYYVLVSRKKNLISFHPGYKEEKKTMQKCMCNACISI